MGPSASATAGGASPSAGATSAGGDPSRVTVGPAVVSRCFDQGPTPIAGAQCDRPAALDAHVLSKRAEIAACARAGARGRLAMVLEYRFSTQFARGWGGPAWGPGFGPRRRCWINQWGELVCRRRRIYW